MWGQALQHAGAVGDTQAQAICLLATSPRVAWLVDALELQAQLPDIGASILGCMLGRGEGLPAMPAPRLLFGRRLRFHSAFFVPARPPALLPSVLRG